MNNGLSILIPTYADNPQLLIESLIQQQCSYPFEIIVLIDGLDFEKYHTSWIKKYSLNSTIKIIQVPENKGRASSRNMLAQEAKYTHLLFLDADTLPIDARYLENYSSHLNDKIVCGGNAYRFAWNRILNLRYRYGKCAEETPAIKRNQTPYQSFSSNNFIIPKALFEQIQFDFSIKNYGHEDTLFGLQCQDKNISILHIDNAIYHEGLESNKTFIHKSETALVTLLDLHKSNKIKNTRLLNSYLKMRSNISLSLFLKFSTLFLIPIKITLQYILPSVILFNFYKLIYFYKIENAHRTV